MGGNRALVIERRTDGIVKSRTQDDDGEVVLVNAGYTRMAKAVPLRVSRGWEKAKKYPRKARNSFLNSLNIDRLGRRGG